MSCWSHFNGSVVTFSNINTAATFICKESRRCLLVAIDDMAFILDTWMYLLISILTTVDEGLVKSTLNFLRAAVVLISLDFFNQLLCFQVQLLTLTTRTEKRSTFCLDILHGRKLITENWNQKRIKMWSFWCRTHMRRQLQREKSSDDVVSPNKKKKKPTQDILITNTEMEK